MPTKISKTSGIAATAFLMLAGAGVLLWLFAFRTTTDAKETSRSGKPFGASFNQVGSLRLSGGAAGNAGAADALSIPATSAANLASYSFNGLLTQAGTLPLHGTAANLGAAAAFSVPATSAANLGSYSFNGPLTQAGTLPLHGTAANLGAAAVALSVPLTNLAALRASSSVATAARAPIWWPGFCASTKACSPAFKTRFPAAKTKYVVLWYTKNKPGTSGQLVFFDPATKNVIAKTPIAKMAGVEGGIPWCCGAFDPGMSMIVAARFNGKFDAKTAYLIKFT